MLDRDTIPTLTASVDGHHFVVYGDSCSGIAGAPHAANLRHVNAAIRALESPPEFICFLGDEIMGLTTDADELRRQWRHFFGRELAWLDRAAIPLYNTTGNHTTYDPMSAKDFSRSHAPPAARNTRLACLISSGAAICCSSSSTRSTSIRRWRGHGRHRLDQ